MMYISYENSKNQRSDRVSLKDVNFIYNSNQTYTYDLPLCNVHMYSKVSTSSLAHLPAHTHRPSEQ